MSPQTRPAEFQRRTDAGFSLIEILVVLAIFALATAVIMPSTGRLLAQTTSHAVFFEFQREVSEMRREANRTNQSIRIVDPEVDPDPALGERHVALREPWTYRMAPTLDIAEGGACGATTVNLLDGDRVVMTLRSDRGDCRFTRLTTTAASPRAPSPQ